MPACDATYALSSPLSQPPCPFHTTPPFVLTRLSTQPAHPHARTASLPSVAPLLGARGPLYRGAGVDAVPHALTGPVRDAPQVQGRMIEVCHSARSVGSESFSWLGRPWPACMRTCACGVQGVRACTRPTLRLWSSNGTCRRVVVGPVVVGGFGGLGPWELTHRGTWHGCGTGLSTRGA